MKDYSRVRNILSVFSVETGLDDASAREIYERALKADRELQADVISALSDPDVSWSQLLLNEDTEIYEADNEEEAKDYAALILSSDLLRCK
jgi:hypothetical protein